MRRIILAIVSTTAVLVFLLTFKTHSVSSVTAPPAAVGTPSASAGGGPGTSSGTGTSRGASPAPSSAPGGSGGGSTSGGTTSAAKTVTGDAADTIYGPVQVQITVKRGKLTAANATVYPTETPRDAQINAYAIPQLEQETVAAGNANIDAISGATYTSNGYIASLQSALSKAGI
jgi:major membrane immunogen (membrane-anchored lipoprotein)